MRSVCFVDHLEFEFTGSVFKSAIALGDVDNDGEIELIVGNLSGDLVIYKHDKMWQKINNLGMITAVGVGDIMNCGSNALVIVCGDGWCHICLCLHPKSEDNEEVISNVKLEPVHIQRIPPNTKVLLLEDVDGDGNIEMVLGLTDRVVRSYRWVQSATGGRLVCLFKWECANQVGGIALNHNAQGLPRVLVAQPGGTVMTINTEITPTPTVEKDGELNKRNEYLLPSSVEYHPLMVSRMRNPNISTEIIADLAQGASSPRGKGKPYVVATLDGTLMLIKDEEIVWSYQVDHQLFVLNKLDVTGDGRDEIVACSWDGQTYILDQDKNSVRFHLEESVSTFCAGLYTLTASSPPVPCFVYVTFNNKILLYYDVKIPKMVTENLISMILESDEAKSMIGEDILKDRKRLQQLIRWCLYGRRCHKTKTSEITLSDQK